VALGEQLHTTDAPTEFFAQQAIAWVQPDVTRMSPGKQKRIPSE
jgi:L-alanine-DL-glutamate epimerase-like enolase superfamily enzyme